jgi:alpha-galactosidase
MLTARRWASEAFGISSDARLGPPFPISFQYATRASVGLLPGWSARRTEQASDDGSSRIVVEADDPSTGLACRAEVILYADFPAVEWVGYFKNTGASDSPIISDIQALDTVFIVGRGQRCRLHHARGSQCRDDDFEPQETCFTHYQAASTAIDVRLASVGGRSSDGALPFFNLEIGGTGVIGAIGWSGDWAATFTYSPEGLIRIRAGMQRTHLRLHPGEEIRTPRILLLFWENDWLHGQNLLRQFILSHHTPRPNGAVLRGPLCDSAWGDRLDRDQIAQATWLVEQGLGFEYFWIDADWYGETPHVETSDTFGTTWYRQVGNWFPKKDAYPNGLKAVGDALRSLGLGFILWVEPERAARKTRIVHEHPDWVIGPVGENYLFNLGIPAARAFLTDLLSDIIREGGVTCLRQDFNVRPASFWAAADPPDRVGISEIRHIEGLYALWDDLLARHPGLIIDNCASGGRRIDLETISRSIALWRSDVQCSPHFSLTAMQNQTHGLSLWVPLSAGVATELTTYAFRSALSPAMVVPWGERGRKDPAGFPIEWARRMIAEFKAIRPCFSGDFYPLVSYSLADDTWVVWQFDRPDLGEGMVLFLRRPHSPFLRWAAALRGLAPDAIYDLHFRERNRRERRSGRDLLERGIVVDLEQAPDSELVTYRRVERDV